MNNKIFLNGNKKYMEIRQIFTSYKSYKTVMEFVIRL